MEFVSIQKNVGHSPRKLRLVADMIRKMTPIKAIEALEFNSRAASKDLIKAIKTALANGGNLANLTFKKIEINEGMKMKRYRVGTAGRGRGRPYQKRLSHIKIVLSDEMVTSDKVKVTSKKKEGREKAVVLDDSAVKTGLTEKATTESSK
ncbi:50S ribosomal protein L22 [Candidatus Daviesbacteria bacterium]|nr:50S ribosomal protein L22 [Candidatus Daviesbacteria bacterium]